MYAMWHAPHTETVERHGSSRVRAPVSSDHTLSVSRESDRVCPRSGNTGLVAPSVILNESILYTSVYIDTEDYCHCIIKYY